MPFCKWLANNSTPMKDKTHYANGQKVFDQVGERLTYYFKDGKVKAQGVSNQEVMNGEWRFYRESGELWQVGNFKDGIKHGSWVRYHRNGELEYDGLFDTGKLLKK